jgi:hypothetical protein
MAGNTGKMQDSNLLSAHWELLVDILHEMQTQATTEIPLKELSGLKDFGMPQDWQRNSRSRVLFLDVFRVSH